MRQGRFLIAGSTQMRTRAQPERRLNYPCSKIIPGIQHVKIRSRRSPRAGHQSSGGGTRTRLACSKAQASRISFASLNAPPMNDTPIGRPATYPAGTVMLG